MRFEGIRMFYYSNTERKDWMERLAGFLSVMYEDELDPKYIGFVFLALIKTPFVERSKNEASDNNRTRDKILKVVGCYRSDEIADKIMDLTFYKHDYYVKKNRFKSTKNLNQEALFGYSAIVIDIDNHIYIHKGKEQERVDRINELVFAMNEMLFDGPDFPSPNAIVYTGRGLQLWWKVLPCATQFYSKAYNTVVNFIMTSIKDFLASGTGGRFSDFFVDTSVTQNESAWVRLPGSYNTHTLGYGDFFLIHADSINLYEKTKKIWNKDETAVFIKPEGIKKENWKSMETPVTSQKYNRSDSLAEKRERQLMKLLDWRHQKKPETPELRDLFLLTIFSCFLQETGDSQIAFSHAFAFNQYFNNPMPEKEIRVYMKSSLKNGGYKFSNQKIIDELEIDPEEQDFTGLHPSTRKNCNTKEIEQKRKDRQKRDDEIKELCRNGFTKTEIAKAVGCSNATVARVLKTAGETTEKEKLHDQIIQEYRQGASEKDLVKKYGDRITRGGVQYIIRKTK